MEQAEMDNVRRYTLSKEERLSSEKAIASLFASGSAFVKFPVRVVYAVSECGTDEVHCRILTSVPKKRFKHAVDRNRVKRLMRESYRLNKYILLDKVGNKRVDVAFVCVDSKLPSYVQMQKAIKTALERIATSIESNEEGVSNNN